MNPSLQPAHSLDLNELTTSEYVRQRSSPQPRDQFYLHLLDLLAALKNAIPAGPGKVLDFGAGGSPYRSLFTSSTYLRADLPGTSPLDIPLSLDGSLPPHIERDFDLVFSSQVLEHVVDSHQYLTQAFGVLRPGGTLIVSTHGTFPDHPCPLDLWRWTSSGLRHQIESAGFIVHSVTRLTHGFRAAWFLLDQSLLANPSGSLIRRLLRRLHLTLRPIVNRIVNRATLSHSQIPETQNDSGIDLCIGLLAIAHKP